MHDKVTWEKVLYQDEAVKQIEQLFGKDWVYENDHGRRGIDRRVLTTFRKLHGGSIGWDADAKSWSLA